MGGISRALSHFGHHKSKIDGGAPLPEAGAALFDPNAPLSGRRPARPSAPLPAQAPTTGSQKLQTRTHPAPGPHRIPEGTTTTPFDMTVRNRASRYHLVMDAINNAKRLPRGATELKQWCEQQLARHEAYVVEHLEDMPEVRDWSLGDWAQQG